MKILIRALGLLLIILIVSCCTDVSNNVTYSVVYKAQDTVLYNPKMSQDVFDSLPKENVILSISERYEGTETYQVIRSMVHQEREYVYAPVTEDYMKGNNFVLYYRPFSHAILPWRRVRYEYKDSAVVFNIQEMLYNKGFECLRIKEKQLNFPEWAAFNNSVYIEKD